MAVRLIVVEIQDSALTERITTICWPGLQLLQLKGQIILFIQLAFAINYHSWIKFSQRPQQLSLTSNRCSKTAANTHSTGSRQHLRVPQLILIKERYALYKNKQSNAFKTFKPADPSQCMRACKCHKTVKFNSRNTKHSKVSSVKLLKSAHFELFLEV